MEYAVFSSGGLAGITLVGCLKYLLEQGNKFKGVSGCSFGSILATLYSIGYTIEEIDKIVLETDINKLIDIHLEDFMDSYGLESGKKFRKFFGKLIKSKTGSRATTFSEHYEKYGIELWINSACITKMSCEYYSHHTSPDMQILEALMRSISIPLIFKAIKTGSDIYVDGAYYDPIPCKMFPVEKTICLAINTPFSKLDPRELKIQKYFLFIVKGMHKSLHRGRIDKIKEQGYKIIQLAPKINDAVYEVSFEERKKLMEYGYNKIKRVV